MASHTEQMKAKVKDMGSVLERRGSQDEEEEDGDERAEECAKGHSVLTLDFCVCFNPMAG